MAKETKTPEATVEVKNVVSDLSALMAEATHQGRVGSGEGIMSQFKDRLISVLTEAVNEAKQAGEEVKPIPAGAVVRFFLKRTDIFETLNKDDRYNRAYRYLSQAKKVINRIGWDIDKIGKTSYLIYTGKIV
jgi:hypothetical protein